MKARTMDAQAKVTIVWVAYALGIVITGSPFVAVIMAYFCRNTNDEPGLAGHNAAQIRSFWWGFAGWVVAIAMIAGGLSIGLADTAPNGESIIAGTLLFLIGLLFAVIVQITFTIYAIVGIVRASKRKNWPGAEVQQNPAAVFG